MDGRGAGPIRCTRGGMDDLPFTPTDASSIATASRSPSHDHLTRARVRLLPASWQRSARNPGAARCDLRQAGELLDAAGWVVGDDGVRRNADGEVLESFADG